MDPIVFPIAETFHSYQGEGLYTGTPMFFVRTAGCSVGKLPADQSDPDINVLAQLKTGAPAWVCKTYDGRSFLCDTDFNRHADISLEDLLNATKEKHICLTGGEPLIHKEKITVLVKEADKLGIQVHLETSGTIDYFRPEVWLTVSPKVGVKDIMLRRADEIKLLVDPGFSDDKLPDYVHNHPLVYVQPINNESSVNLDNLKLCYDVLERHPKWRLSIQLHKMLGLQ